jgi:thioredoxin-like negative regulator of GroEL
VPVGKLLTGHPTEALSHCGELIERRRLTDMLPSTQDAVSAAKDGDLSTACTLLDQCIQKETDPAALFQAALCYRSADRVNDALSLLKTLEDRGQTQPPALLLRADIFCSLDRHQHALPLYKRLAEIEHAPMQYSAALGLLTAETSALVSR